MSWSDILKEDRSNNRIWVEYTIDGERKTIGPFSFNDFDKEYDAVPALATNIIIIEKQYSRSGEFLGAKTFRG